MTIAVVLARPLFSSLPQFNSVFESSIHNTKVFWKPTIDNNKVGAYYYNDDDHPLSLHDEIHHNGATQYGGHLNEGEETSGNSTDLPWHWVFGE